MSGQHRVYLPGPHSNKLPMIVDHPDGCELDTCPVAAGIADWLANLTHQPISVQGDYFTDDGKNYTRCHWQPNRRLT